jgi:alkylation response protein AidB-like acyl-CoA dehydrogenase
VNEVRLDLTDEQKLVQQTVRHVKPLAKKLDETCRFPRETFRKAAELGVTAALR